MWYLHRQAPSPSKSRKVNPTSMTLLDEVLERRGLELELERSKIEVEDLKAEVEQLRSALTGALAKLTSNLKVTMSKFMRENDGVLLKDCFTEWKRILEDRRLASAFTEKMNQANEAVTQKIARTVQSMFASNEQTHRRVVLEAWSSYARTTRLEKAHLQQMEEKRQRALIKWRDGDNNLRKVVCFSSWTKFTQEATREARIARDKAEHERVAQELIKENARRTAMALVSGAGQMDPAMLRLLVQGWRGIVIDTQKKQSDERQKKKMFLLLTQKNSKAQLGAMFEMWRTVIQEERHQRELDQMRKEQEELRQENAKMLASQSKARSSMMMMTGNGNNGVFLAMVWSAWRETHTDAVLRRKLEKQKWEWEREISYKHERNLKDMRNKQAGVSLMLQLKSDGLRTQLIRDMLWAGWVHVVSDAKRQKQRDGSKQLHEDERMQLVKANQKAKDGHTMLFHMQLTGKDNGEKGIYTVETFGKTYYDEKLEKQQVTMSLVEEHLADLQEALKLAVPKKKRGVFSFFWGGKSKKKVAPVSPTNSVTSSISDPGPGIAG